MDVGGLEVRGLGKTYEPGAPVVADVDLEVADGELVVVVGPSGCGKSTLLRMIAGLEAPTTGSVLIGGVDMDGLGAARRDVAMVFQSGALYPHLTVRQNLGFPLVVTGVRRRDVDAQVTAMADVLHLGGLLDRRPHQLSGGQRQRVAMGRAIIRRPVLFLMDEPLSSLDTKLRVEMRAAIVTMQRRLGVMMVVVTHDSVEAMAMADRLLVMRDGRVVQTGTPETVYAEPVDRFVGTFLGYPPMAIVPATVETADADAPARCVVRLAGCAFPVEIPLPLGPIEVGVRSELLRLDPSGPLTGSYVGMEDLGHERVVHIVVTDELGREVRLDLVVGSDVDLDLWRPVGLGVEASGFRYFDPGTGLRIAGP